MAEYQCKSYSGHEPFIKNEAIVFKEKSGEGYGAKTAVQDRDYCAEKSLRSLQCRVGGERYRSVLEERGALGDDGDTGKADSEGYCEHFEISRKYLGAFAAA